MPDSPARDNPRAEQAFADYVALGSSRSLAVLHARYQTVPESSPTRRLPTLKEWSVKYRWQTRIADAATAQSMAMLQEASHLDADTFLATSRLINERVHLSTPMHTDVVIKMRESVRKPAPKGGASLNVNISLEIQHLVDRAAEEDGLTGEEKLALQAAVERHLAGVPS